jgi:hypothetical protein
MRRTEQVRVLQTARITIETDTIMVVRQARTARVWCPLCQVQVDAITPEESNFPEPSSAAHMREWLKTGNLHVLQTSDGPAQVCLVSLLRCFELDGFPKVQIAKESI